MINNDDPRLTSFVLSELTLAEHELIEQAVLASPELAKTVEGIRQLTEVLDAAYQLEEPLHLTLDQRAELDAMQKIERRLGEQPAFSDRSWSPLVLAATLLGLLVAGSFLFSDPQENRIASLPANSKGLEIAESSLQEAESSDDVHESNSGKESYQTLDEASVVESMASEASKDEGSAELNDTNGLELGTGLGRGGIARSQMRSSGAAALPKNSLRPFTDRVPPVAAKEPELDSAVESEASEMVLGQQLEQDSVEGGVLPGRSLRLNSQVEKQDENGKLYRQSIKAGQRAMSAQSIDNLTKDKKNLGEFQSNQRTWKRVAASPNTSRLMVGDKAELDLSGMQVNVQVDGFRARVLLDYLYYNDENRQLEGEFKLRLPDDASLYYFAFGESVYGLNSQGAPLADEFLESDDNWASLKADDIRQTRKQHWVSVKESQMVPIEKAAHALRETVRQKVDPALAEWVGAGVFNARVFPLAPKKLHRIVIGYDLNLKQVGGEWVYDLQLPEQTGKIRVDLKVQAKPRAKYKIQPVVESEKIKDKNSQQLHFRFDEKPEKPIRLLIK
jgi:hypothetical protein